MLGRLGTERRSNSIKNGHEKHPKCVLGFLWASLSDLLKRNLGCSHSLS